MKIRYRIHRRLFRSPLIVVQIHETLNHSISTHGVIDDWQSNVWRNARIEDLAAKTLEGVVLA